MSGLISRQAAIDTVKGEFFGALTPEERACAIRDIPSAQPEPWEDERKKIADALSEKMAYMNTCLNERDIILGYLGVKRPNETHCNSDCRNEKCESYHYATKELPSAQRWIPCSERLPEEDFWSGRGRQFSYHVLVTIVNHENDDEQFTDIAQTVDGIWRLSHDVDGDCSLPNWCEVIAWMPLPEPYKGEDT